MSTGRSQKKARIEDALHPTRAVLAESGILPGGGIALLRATAAIDRSGLEGDEAVGAGIVRRALEAPIRQIAANAGVDGSIVIQNVLAKKDQNHGYNAAADTYVDMVKAGVIDPAKVTCTALQNAASVATLLLTTEALVSVVPEKKKGGGEDMGDMDY